MENGNNSTSISTTNYQIVTFENVKIFSWTLVKHQLFCKRAGIEPTIGHLKADYRLGRNFYKGVVGNAVNTLLAAAAYNFKRAMNALLALKKAIDEILLFYNISSRWSF